MSTALIQARKDAIARGDKALGRELYGQLIGLGYLPEDIDASTFTEYVPVPVSVDPSPEPEVETPPSNDPAVVQRWNYRQALAGELGMVSNPKNGNPRRAEEIKVELDKADAELAALVAPETTQAPEAPEAAVKPSPKRRTRKDAADA